MKILVVSQYYYPEPFRITDICENLAKRGHEVTVLTGQPNYPEGKIYNDYKNEYSKEEINNVRVIRTKISPRRKGAFSLLLNYLSFPYYSKKVIKEIDRDFDLVFINQLSPVMSALPGLKYSKKNGKKTILYCLDLWPESLVSGGISTKSFIYKIFARWSKSIYRSADKILISSKSFKDKFEKYNITTHYLPQYAEDFYGQQFEDTLNSKFNVTFAGNIGEMQSVETILFAAEILKQHLDIEFNIYGDGSKFEEIKRLKNKLKLDNLILHGRVDSSLMPKVFCSSDVLLVTLKKEPNISKTLPGKVQSYMASSKPIIAAIDGETALVLEESRAGYYCEAEDYIGLSKLILEAKNNPRLESLGKNGKTYYDNNFSKEHFYQSLEKFMEDLLDV